MAQTVKDLIDLLKLEDPNLEIGLMESNWFDDTIKIKQIAINRKNEKVKLDSPDSRKVLILR